MDLYKIIEQYASYTKIRTSHPDPIEGYIQIYTLNDGEVYYITDTGDVNKIGRTSGDRGIFGGGYTSVNINDIDYITIASAGNAIDFGDLTLARRRVSGLSSLTRGCFCGGVVSVGDDTIDYVTIATLGNASDFGDLEVNRCLGGGCSNAHGGLI